MSVQLRGGTPRAVRLTAASRRGTVTTAGIPVTCEVTPQAPAGRTNYVRIRNLGANPIRVYFTEAYFTADGPEGYVTVDAAGAVNGRDVLDGPMDIDDDQQPNKATPPIAVRNQSRPIIYLRGAGGSSDCEVLFYHRRG